MHARNGGWEYRAPLGSGGVNPLTNDDITEILLLLLRQYRSESVLLADLGTSVHALQQLAVGSDAKLLAEFERLKAEAEAVFGVPMQMMLQKIDGIIRRLESQRPPRVN
jgi:hypothetical protein